jgi:hypothetical protein
MRQDFLILPKLTYMKNIFAAVLLVGMTFSCNSKDAEPPKQITISGYTPTDANGNIMGAVDASDWTLNEAWSDKETNLFSGISSGDLTGTSSGAVTVSPAFPNPCTLSFGMQIQTASVCKLRFTVVDDRLRVYESGTIPLTAGSHSFGVTLDVDNIPEGLYRIYYSFDAQGAPMFVKGHGDVLVQ